MLPNSNATHLTAEHFYWTRSLKELSAITVIGTICVSNCRIADKGVFESSVKSCIQCLNLPYPLFDTVSDLVADIANTVFDWHRFEYLRKSFFVTIPLDQFVSKYGMRWKWCGMIDSVEMAKLIVNETRFSVQDRFVLACEHSFEEQLKLLWSQCEEEQLKEIVLKLSLDTRHRRSAPPSLLKYWVMQLKGEFVTLLKGTHYTNEHQYGMAAALKEKNLSSIQYFWKLLSETEKSLKLIEYSTEVFRDPFGDKLIHISTIIPFFVSQMSADQQLNLVRGELMVRHAGLLECLLVWPWQDLLLPLMKFAHSSFSDEQMHGFSGLLCSTLLYATVNKVQQCIIQYLWCQLNDKEKCSNISLLFDEHSFNEKLVTSLSDLIGDISADSLKAIAHSEDCLLLALCRMECGKWDQVRLVVSLLLPKEMQELNDFKVNVVELAIERGKSPIDYLAGDEHENLLNSTFLKKLADMIENLEKLFDELCSDGA